MRSIASSEGFTIEASDLAKLKTVIQIVSVVAVILAHGWYAWHYFGWFIAAGGVDCHRGYLLHGAGIDHLRGGLLCSLSGARSTMPLRTGAGASFVLSRRKDIAANKIVLVQPKQTDEGSPMRCKRAGEPAGKWLHSRKQKTGSLH